jgi:hypothetical protein
VKDKITLDSLPSNDRRPRRSQMSMQQPHTRATYKAREIEQSAPTRAERMQANKKKMDSEQSQYRGLTAQARKAQRMQRQRALDDLTDYPTPRGIRTSRRPKSGD